MKPRLIVIDGKTYTSVDEMPADIRLKYEQAMGAFKDQNQNHIPDAFEKGNLLGDQNRNGVPDVFESAFGAGGLVSGMKIIVDGKEVNSVADLPPDARAKYERAMGHLDANSNGVPDFMEAMMGAQQQPVASVQETFRTDPVPRSQPLDSSPTITPDTSNGWMLALLGVVILMACALGAVGVWYFFIR
jgi:hypothetical protein